MLNVFKKEVKELTMLEKFTAELHMAKARAAEFDGWLKDLKSQRAAVIGDCLDDPARAVVKLAEVDSLLQAAEPVQARLAALLQDKVQMVENAKRNEDIKKMAAAAEARNKAIRPAKGIIHSGKHK